MTASDTAALRYSNAAAAFHWITAALVAAQAVLGFIFTESEPAPARDEVFVWHKTVGVLIFVVVLTRIGYRLANPPPPFSSQLPRWQRSVAVWNHRLLYALLLALPIIGWVSVSGYANGPTTPLAGGIPVPVFPGISLETGERAGELHELVADVLLALIALHITAALKHVLLDRSPSPVRMPPFRRRGPADLPQG